MNWLEQLPVRRRHGSRPRCVLLMDGGTDTVADRLTDLVGLPHEVVITCRDLWRPFGKQDVREAQLDDISTSILPPTYPEKLKKWWLIKGKSQQSWDIASTCTIKGRTGLLLVEAKAHDKEFSDRSDKTGAKCPNRKQIGRAIDEAASGLHAATGGTWNLSKDHHYQLSNRFAWSWKLASLGIPVVLLYLGFLNATDMNCRPGSGKLFCSRADWEKSLKSQYEGIIDNSCWGKWLNIKGVPLLPLIQAIDQPFQPLKD